MPTNETTRRVPISRQSGHRNPTATASADTRCEHTPTGSVGAHSTGQQMKLLNLTDTYPTIIAGDFNLHHPDWAEMTIEPIAAAKAMAEWLQDESFPLLNVHNYPKFTIISAYPTQYVT